MINQHITWILTIRVFKPVKERTIIFYNKGRAKYTFITPLITTIRLTYIRKSGNKANISVLVTPVLFQIIYDINGTKAGGTPAGTKI